MNQSIIALFTTALLAVPMAMAGDGGNVIYDFEGRFDKPQWKAENDGVMGGVSEGSGRIENGSLIFEGRLSMENDGGFASLQTEDGEWDLSKYKGVRLRVKGSGRRYQFRMSTDARLKGSRIDYASDFETRAGEWIEVTIRFSEMKPTWRGRELDGPKLDLKNVEQLRIFLGDKREGPFALKIDSITAFE